MPDLQTEMHRAAGEKAVPGQLRPVAALLHASLIRLAKGAVRTCEVYLEEGRAPDRPAQAELLELVDLARQAIRAWEAWARRPG